MSAYTIEDIELIRRKSGISYQEAVSLLDYHNGNVARALVDLERNGRIKPDAETRRAAAASGTSNSSSASGASGASGATGSSAKSGFVNILSALYRARIKVVKDETPVINLSALFSTLSVVIAPHIAIIGVIAALVLGYKFSFTKSDPAFAGENLERMVRSAADNVRSSVNDFAQGFQSGMNGNGSASSTTNATAGSADPNASYYAARPTATASYRPSAPTLNVPVQVESQDGSVTVENDQDGFTNATID